MPLLEVYWKALRYLDVEARRVAVVSAANVALALVLIAEPILFGRIIDAISDRESVWPVLSLWAGLGAFNIVAFVLVSREADRIAHRRRVGVLTDSFEKLIAMPLSWHMQRGTSNVLHTLLRAVDTLSGLWLEFMRQHLSTAVALLLLVPTAVVMDLRMSIVLFVLGALYVLVGRIVMEKTKAGQSMVERHHHAVFSHVSDCISNVSVLQSFNRIEREAQSLRTFTGRLLDAQYPVLDWWAIASAMHRLASTLSMMAILLIGAFLVSQGELRVGEIVAFIGFANLLIARLDQVTAFVNQVFESRVRLEDFYRIEEAVEAEREPDTLRDLGPVSGHVRFENVGFSFGRSGQGVHNVSFEVEAGKTVAIVGPTGAGKTTLINLLQRVHDPVEGRILIDGIDTRTVGRQSLRRSIATVFQDAGMFNRSIEENIRIGRDAASHEDIHEAATAAAAHDFILAKSEGYGTMVGERGGALSGGERQRLAIARAVLKDAPILVLDEATSALDVETESRVKAAIDELRRDRTTFIIAHRLSTVRDADLVIFLEDGRVVESGGFMQLAASNGRFASLLRAGGLLGDEEVRRATVVPVTFPAEVEAA